MAKRCVNIDWLEVFCMEPVAAPCSPEYYIRQGYEVRVRAYGTPQYEQMFTIYEDNFPLIEIRRKPYSIKPQGGIFEPNACHLRLSNRTCYLADPVNFLRTFLITHRYTFVSLTRIDLCLDFNTFDNGRNPAGFVSDFMTERIAKISQSRLAAHGSDSWEGRVWNSLKWGAPTSIVSTKLYNKSLELQQVKDKFYIRDAWKDAGLDENRDVWRVEFSLKAAAQAQIDKQTGEYIPLSLTSYDTREKLWYQFSVLAQKYFHFKRCVWLRKKSGEQVRQRKDRCPDVPTFQYQQRDGEVYEPIRVLTKQPTPTRTDKLLVKRLQEIAAEATDRDVAAAARRMASYMIFHMRMTQFTAKQKQLEDEAANHFELTNETQPINMKKVRERVQQWESKERALLEMLIKKYHVSSAPASCPF